MSSKQAGICGTTSGGGVLYGIMLSLPILALNITQDGSSGQDNGP